jgi:chemosensory pili system protein ChpA (sensor histidine kinase/response regulator)
MVSQRVADDPFGLIRDDLLFALRRIQLDLETYCEDPADPAPLVVMVDAIDQIRGPLVALEHPEAVALLEEMRATALDLASHAAHPPDSARLRQAVERLANYLEASLSPGQRRFNIDLSETANSLRQVRSSAAPDAAITAEPETSQTTRALLDILQRLERTTAENLEPAADQPESWNLLRDDLRALGRLLFESGRPRAGCVLGRLDRIAGALAAGAAEHYGNLVSGVCAEVLAGLRYGLEPAGNGGAALTSILDRAEGYVAPLDTLLNLPPLPETAAMALLQEIPETAVEAESPGAPSPPTATAVTPEWNSPPDAPDADPGAAPAVSDAHPPSCDGDQEAESIVIEADPLELVGLADADPEFVEVFLEEARDALVAIRTELIRWRENLENQEALTVIRRAFHTLKGSGRMVGAMVIGDFAWEFENLLNQVLSGHLAANPAIIDTVAEAVAALAPLVGETPLRGDELKTLPALVARARTLTQVARPESELELELELELEPRPEVVEPATSDVSEIDTEFLEVFLEEAQDGLAAILEQQAVWRLNPADHQAPTIIRRAFHTLKGSGRVVGATAISDFASVFENLLNRTLSGVLGVSSTLVDLVGEAARAMEPLIGLEPASDDAMATLARLTARAEQLSQEPADVAPESIEPVTREERPPAPAADSIQEPTPAAPVTPEPMASPAVDLELAQIFQYEAAEILDACDALLRQLGTESDQSRPLNDLRRSMHTLKGSSRMTGFMTVGDLAHAAESVLDALGKGGVRATTVVLDLLQQTLDRLNGMLAEAAGGSGPGVATELIDELHRLAKRVAAGDLVEELPAVAPVSALEPTPVSEPRSFRDMTELDQELAQVFQAEASDILDSSDALVRRLGEEPDNTELLNDLRREMHTLKGSSRMAGFMTVGDLAHAAESVLDALGKGTLDTARPVLEGIQRALDRLHRMLAGVRAGVQPPTPQDLIDELQGLLGAPPADRPRPAPSTLAVATPAMMAAARPAEKPAAPTAPADTVRVSAALLNALVNQMGESSIFRARIDQGVGAMSFNLNELEQTIARLRRQVSNLATQAEARIQSRQDQSAKAHQLDFDPLELDRFTEQQQMSRSLMEIADDLGNIGGTLSEHAQEISTLLDQQAKVNKEIQQGLMHTGMVRFGSIIPRLRRVVRQAAQELGKRAELLVGGEEAEVDRTVLDKMVAPLEHMLRNSLAHGLETPEMRRAAGKSEIGTISLSLRREGAELVLELGDDGAGLNFAAIRAKGEEKGLLPPDEPATQDELIALLLRPGFSTATSVSQISGRGVGMDVVNEAIRAMRGALLIQTEPSQGTRFIIRLPFSLAVTQALLAQAGDGLFAIPLLSIELVTRLQESEFQAYLSGEPVQHRYNERNYPLHNLGILLGSDQFLPFEEAKDRRPPTLLFRSAEASAALQVEAVLGNQEIIVKPVNPQFNGVPGISGATVLGDGRVVVVLDLAALVRHIGSQRQKQTESRALRMARQEARQEKINIMVIDDSITMRKVTARILERHNVQVITAKDGLDAVAMLQTQAPDLAILDIEMPRMDGFEVLAHVRNQPHLQHLPVIMVTSRGGEKHRERAMKLGVNDYLTKPYQEEKLLQSIRKILGERALELMT